MAEQAFNEAPSRRYTRAYLAIWAVLGVIGLSYLASLVWQPEQLATAQTKTSEAEPGLAAATKALTEIGIVRQVVDTLQKTVGELKGDLKNEVEQRGESDKALQSRVAALEEQFATLPAAPVATSTNTTPTTPAPTPTAPAKPKVAEKPQPKATPVKTPPQPKTGARVIQVPTQPTNSTQVITTVPPLETGSITPPVFGEVVVTRSGEMFAVQLDVAPSVDVLRSRWGILVELHGSTLATLQPRFLPPRTPGAPYRLLAGPLASVADAKEICAELKAQLPACSTIDFGGEPL